MMPQLYFLNLSSKITSCLTHDFLRAAIRAEIYKRSPMSFLGTFCFFSLPYDPMRNYLKLLRRKFNLLRIRLLVGFTFIVI